MRTDKMTTLAMRTMIHTIHH